MAMGWKDVRLPSLAVAGVLLVAQLFLDGGGRVCREPLSKLGNVSVPPR